MCDKLNILWLCPFQISLLEPEARLIRKNINERSAPWIENLSKELARRSNINLTIITKSANIITTQEFKKYGISFIIIKHNFPFLKKGFPYYMPIDKIFRYAYLRKKIIKHINSIKPDIIHAHGTETVYSLLASKLKYPSVISIQGLISVYNKTNRRKQKLQEAIEVQSIKNSKNFGCRTIWDKEEVLNINPKAKIHYLPEAMNPVFFNKKWKLINKNKIVFVGSIQSRKGVKELIYAFKLLIKKLPALELHLIGSGNDLLIQELKHYSKQNQFENQVYWHGFLNHGKIIDILLSSTVFVLPTYIDNSPNSLGEAMVLGMPCVASNVGGIPSLIEHNKNGLLVKKGNIQELADSIESIILDESLSSRLSKNAREDAYERHYPSKVADQTIQVYKEIINQNE